jgi:hypothetical protein
LVTKLKEGTNKMEPLTRCSNGHYYDSKKHTSCPFCGVQNLGIDIQKTMAKRPGNSGYEINATKPLGHAQGQGDVGKTKGIYKQKIGIEPVTGWLVSISGPEKGLDYRIKAERNFIGRSEAMDIRIVKDETISRENHASVSYSPKTKAFRLYPGDSRGLVYLNDQEVLTPELLKPFDIIELGTTRLMFVPFCGERFQWSNLESEESITNTEDNE